MFDYLLYLVIALQCYVFLRRLVYIYRDTLDEYFGIYELSGMRLNSEGSWEHFGPVWRSGKFYKNVYRFMKKVFYFYKE
jgi:hypothetical protein